MGINFHSKKNEILVGLIGNCNDCHHDGNNSGVGQIYRLHPGTGTLVAGNNPGSMGTIRAFNLRVGVVETSDTGFVAVSARRNVNPFVPPTNQELGTFTLCTQMLSTDPANVSPYTSGYYGYWDSDPLIVKFDKNGTKIWEWSEDVVPGRARQAPPIDIKRQECMYKVSEAEDGGYVISGNASSYRDDFYMMKLYPECGALHTYATGMTISSNYTLSTSWDFKGVTTINSGAVLTITGPTTKIRFADSRHTGVPTYIQVKPGGQTRTTKWCRAFLDQ